jgi:2,3-bisphosphoglycerate-independent phosphoglycerate mutase
MIFFNFRKDRPRQLVAALALPTFTNFDRGDFPLVNLTCLMPYDKNFQLAYAFTPEKPRTTLAEVISQHGLRQFHCAETEKYAHVTYFFNGGHTTTFSGETHLLIPSPGVATYDQKPEMSAAEVGQAIVKAIKSEKYDFIVVNFANGDMVGHTGKMDAAIKAVETLDKQVGRIFEVAEAHRYSVIMTADHGNCEAMMDETNHAPHTQHTTNPVPCLIMDEEYWQLADDCGLSNVAPTILQLMGIDKPAAMTSDSMLIKSKGKVHSRYHLDGAA